MKSWLFYEAYSSVMQPPSEDRAEKGPGADLTHQRLNTRQDSVPLCEQHTEPVARLVRKMTVITVAFGLDLRTGFIVMNENKQFSQLDV